MSTAKEALRIKRSHHLWSAEKDVAGKIKVNRSAAEKEEWETMENKRTASRKEADRETVNALWGLFGASLVDNSSLNSEIPKSIVQRFNACSAPDAPVIKSWEELRTAFGDEAIRTVRAAIAQGIKVRLASKYLDLPFIMTKDVMDVTASVDIKHVKKIVDGVKNNKTAEVVKMYGKDAISIANIFDGFKKSGMTKISIDDKAKKVWEDYFGPYGKELVRSVQKRVRADLAEKWFRKHAVDEAASKMWATYFGEYGEKWCAHVPSLLRPTK